MHSIGYHIKRAARGATSKPLMFALTLGSIALAFLLVGVAFLMAQNLSRVTTRWGSATVAPEVSERCHTPSKSAGQVPPLVV